MDEERGSDHGNAWLGVRATAVGGSSFGEEEWASRWKRSGVRVVDWIGCFFIAVEGSAWWGGEVNRF